MQIIKKIVFLFTASAVIFMSCMNISAGTGAYNYNLIGLNDTAEKIADLTFEANNYISGNFIGDNKTDYASIVKTGYDQIQIVVWESKGSAFKDPVIYYADFPFVLEKAEWMIKSGDFNGDGKDDIGCLYDDPESEYLRFYVMQFSSNNIVTRSTWYSVKKSAFSASNSKKRCVAGDFNGDGKDDFGVLYKSSSIGMQMRTFITNSAGTGTASSSTWLNISNYDETKIYDRIVSGDFDGNGKDDVGVIYDLGNGSMQIHCLISNGSSFAKATWFSHSQISVGNLNSDVICGDMNGDGKDEIIGIYYFSPSKTRVFIWSKNSSNAFSMTFNEYKDPFWLHTTKRIQGGDYNGDGKYDAAFMAKENSNNLTKYNLKLYLTASNGSSHTISNGYSNLHSQSFTTTSSNTEVFTKPQNKGVRVANLSAGTNVTILGYESFNEYNGTTYNTVYYYYIEFNTTYGISRGYIRENYTYPATVTVGYMNYGEYLNYTTQPISYFNTNIAYHGPGTSYKSFDGTIPANTIITILDCVKYDPINNQYWFWIEFNSSSGIKRGFLSANNNSML